MAPEVQSKTVRQQRVLRRGLFAKDLAPMMYGFGDSENPAPDTINVMEELLIEHITDVCQQAQRVATNKGKIKVEDFKFALRRDAKKLARVEELLFMSEVINRAKGKIDDYAGMAGEDDKRGGGTTAAGGGGGGSTTTAATITATPGPIGDPKGKGKAKLK